MKLITTDGFVMSSLKYGETSKILNVFTKDYGIIGILARGCMNPKNKNRIVCDNFTYAKFNIKYKEGKLSTLIEADINNYLFNIRDNYTLINYLSYIVKLTKDVYLESHNSKIYDLFISSILKLNEKMNPKVIANILETKYLDYLGVGLHLDGCVKCNNTHVVALSIKENGYLCKNCYDGSIFTSLELLKTIKIYKNIDISKIKKIDISEKVIDEIDTFLYHYYKDYTGIYIEYKKNLNKLLSNV